MSRTTVDLPAFSDDTKPSAFNGDPDFECYIEEILRVMRAKHPKSLSTFNALCQIDLNAGYYHEVAEARRRYFGASS